MDLSAVAVVAATVFLWGLVSARLQRADLTAPIIFVLAGAALGGLGLLRAPEAPETLRPLLEVTLVWVLFADAARVRARDLRGDAGLYLRLLGVGLPLTVLAGWGAALWLVPGLDPWLALLVGAALAPTDAALGVPVVTNPAVPLPVRRLLTVESGLNDGVVTPVVALAVAAAASEEQAAGAVGPGSAAWELVLGAAVGIVLGAVGGRLLRRARARGWAAEDFSGVAVLALAVGAWGASVALGGNGFVAAFCGGLAFGSAAGPRGRHELVFIEQTSGLLSLLVWLVFGAVAVPLVARDLSLAEVGYAAASLTVVRMVPVALATLGAGLDRRTVLFVGWFGPRGLASLVFALLALEGLGSDADPAVSLVAVTVLLSVLAHGASARPWATRYGGAEAHATGGVGAEMPVRGLPRRG